MCLICKVLMFCMKRMHSCPLGTHSCKHASTCSHHSLLTKERYVYVAASAVQASLCSGDARTALISALAVVEPRLPRTAYFGSAECGTDAVALRLRLSHVADTPQWPPFHTCSRLPRQQHLAQDPAGMPGRVRLAPCLTKTQTCVLCPQCAHLCYGAGEGAQERCSSRRAAHAPEQALRQPALTQAAVRWPQVACRRLY